MRSLFIPLGAFSIFLGCAHQDAAPPVPQPQIAPVQTPRPRPVKRQDDLSALSQQVMAGNIEPLEGADPELPDQVLAAAHGQVLEGSYKVCVTSDGKVQSVTPVISIDGADQCIVDTLKSWRFPKLPMTVCKLQTLRFEIP